MVVNLPSSPVVEINQPAIKTRIIKARAKIFPSDIDKFSEQGVGIALVQAKASPKTKQRAEAKGIKLYDDLSPEKVKEVREKVKKGKTGGNNNAWYYIFQKTK